MVDSLVSTSINMFIVEIMLTRTELAGHACKTALAVPEQQKQPTTVK
jgi:hypothetical protein